MLYKFLSFYRLPWRCKKIFFKVIFLSIYRGLFFLLNFPHAFTENLIKKTTSQKVLKHRDSQLTIAKDIAFAIELGRKYIPWKNLCRHQAWQAVYLLQKAGIPFTYHVGVKINEPKRGEGHAWVMVNGKFISGKCRVSDYKEIVFNSQSNSYSDL